MKIDKDVIKMLSFLASTYEGMTKFIVSTRNRLHATNPEAMVDENEIVSESEKIKNKISRRIEKELEFFPIWNQWLKHVPGIGPAIASKLILLFNYRFMVVCPVCDTAVIKKEKKEAENGDNGKKQVGMFWCPSCEKSLKGDGILQFRIEEKDFPTISKWWAYMGRHNIEGKMPKRAKGRQVNWSTDGRTIGFQIGESFIKNGPDHLYRQVYDVRRAKADREHPDASKMHRMRMAKNEMVKLFLAHFWTVSRNLDGKPVTEPYAMTILGHTGYVQPFYFGQNKNETNSASASQAAGETNVDVAPRKRGRPRKQAAEARV